MHVKIKNKTRKETLYELYFTKTHPRLLAILQSSTVIQVIIVDFQVPTDN